MCALMLYQYVYSWINDKEVSGLQYLTFDIYYLKKAQTSMLPRIIYPFSFYLLIPVHKKESSFKHFCKRIKQTKTPLPGDFNAKAALIESNSEPKHGSTH